MTSHNVVHMHNDVVPNLLQLKRQARRLQRNDAGGGRRSYMQYLDEAARNVYGLRHYHEAIRLSRRRPNPGATPFELYRQTLQEYYLDF